MLNSLPGIAIRAASNDHSRFRLTVTFETIESAKEDVWGLHQEMKGVGIPWCCSCSVLRTCSAVKHIRTRSLPSKKEPWVYQPC